MSALPAVVPVVPVLVLRQGIPVRQVPRRGRGPPAGVGEQDGMRVVQPGAELRGGGVFVLRPQRYREEGSRVLGGGEGD